MAKKSEKKKSGKRGKRYLKGYIQGSRWALRSAVMGNADPAFLRGFVQACLDVL